MRSSGSKEEKRSCNPFMDHSLVVAKGLQCSYEPCRVGPPMTDGSWWRVLTKRGPLEEEMANHSSILATGTP